MAAIFQTTFKMDLFKTKMYEFWSEFHWSFFLRRVIGQYHGGWWPEDKRNQCTNSHDINVVIPEYSGFKMSILYKFCYTRKTLELAHVLVFFLQLTGTAFVKHMTSIADTILRLHAAWLIYHTHKTQLRGAELSKEIKGNNWDEAYLPRLSAIFDILFITSNFNFGIELSSINGKGLSL